MDFSKTWKQCLSPANIKAATPANKASTECGTEWYSWSTRCPLRMKTVRNSRAMEGTAFFVSQHSSIEMLGSMPGGSWTFCGGRLNVNWKMLPAVQPEHQHLTVLAKKNKGNYYWRYFILIHPPSAVERKTHGLSEIKCMCFFPMMG